MWYKLSDLFDLQMGKTPSRNNPNYWNSKDYLWVSISDMSGYDKYVSSAKEYISERAVKESGIKTIPANTVIMSFKLSIGKTAITTESIFSNEAIMAFIDKKTTAIDPEYIFYLFSGKDWDEGSNKAVMGKTLNKVTLSNTEVDIPSLDIQKERVDKLNKISTLIADKKQQLNQLDELVKARFVEMFGDPSKGDKIKTDKRKIGEIATVTKLAGFEFTKYINYQEEGDIIMLRGLNCKNGHLVLDDIKWIDQAISDALPRSKLYKGDILMTYAGTIGDVAMVDKDNTYHLAPNVGKISINNTNEINPVFLTQLFLNTHDYIMSFASQVAQASINMQKIRDFDYYFPPIELQNQFATFVAQVDKSKFALSNELAMGNFYIRLIHDCIMHGCIDL